MPWHFWVKMRISASCRAASSSSGFRCATSMRRLYSASSSLRCRSARDMTSVACLKSCCFASFFSVSSSCSSVLDFLKRIFETCSTTSFSRSTRAISCFSIRIACRTLQSSSTSSIFLAHLAKSCDFSILKAFSRLAFSSRWRPSSVATRNDCSCTLTAPVWLKLVSAVIYSWRPDRWSVSCWRSTIFSWKDGTPNGVLPSAPRE
mmetsp:Transcript_20896/g.56247  ORF Transcript_20896/g.56247 Transcript_20896/m.56247 type:complete len:205 (+) Transcript_20896:421-1035(+)